MLGIHLLLAAPHFSCFIGFLIGISFAEDSRSGRVTTQSDAPGAMPDEFILILRSLI